jgi:hypothetical protein
VPTLRPGGARSHAAKLLLKYVTLPSRTSCSVACQTSSCSGPVYVMHLVRVDVIGLQPRQTRLTRPPDDLLADSAACGPP